MLVNEFEVPAGAPILMVIGYTDGSDEMIVQKWPLTIMKDQGLIDDAKWSAAKIDIIDFNEPANIGGVGNEDFLLLDNPRADVVFLNHLPPQYENSFYCKFDESKGRVPKLSYKGLGAQDLSIHNQDVSRWSSQLKTCDPKLIVVRGGEHVVTQRNLLSLMGDDFCQATRKFENGSSGITVVMSQKHAETLSSSYRSKFEFC